MASISHSAARRPFSSWGWATVVSAGVARAATETAQRGLGWDRHAELGCRLEGAEREHVAHREDRRRPRLAPQQVERGNARRFERVPPARADGAVVPGRAETLLVARKSLR